MAEESSLLQRQLQFLKQKLDPAIQGIAQEFSFDNVFPQGIMGALVGPGSLNAANDYVGNPASDYLNDLNLKTENYMSSDSDTQGQQIIKELLEGLRGIGETTLDVLEYPGRKVEEGIEFLQSPSDLRLEEAAKEDEIENQRRLAIEELGSFTVDQELLDNADELSDFGFLDVTQFDVETERQRKIDAEEFRANEAQLVKTQGGLNSMTIAESDKINAESELNAEDGFMAAMDDFLGSARGASPDKKERTLEQYRKEFADATGIDVSGEVDKKDALMAFGLALMQNKAGKNFNVSKMLTGVGVAAEKAMPALTKAKEEAKKAGLAAGKYALEARNLDQTKDEANVEKGKQRSAFYIVPKGKGVSGFLANIDQGQLENLNPFELDALMSNESFQEKFDVVPGSTWSGIVEEAMKTPEAAALYLTKNPNTISLIPGVESDLFTIKTFSADPNVAGSEGRSARLDGDGQEQYRALAAAAQDLERAKGKFMEGFGLAEGTSAFRFTVDKVDSLAGAFGINVGGGANDTEKLKLFLTKLQAQNAKEILGEAGKTISDADRALVMSIVGNVDVLSNPDLLSEKMNQLYNDIIIKKERQIFSALQTLDRYSGRKIASRLGGGGELNAEEQAELDAAIAAIGEQNG